MSTSTFSTRLYRLATSTATMLIVLWVVGAVSPQTAAGSRLSGAALNRPNGSMSPSDTYSYTVYFPVIMGPYSVRFSGRVLEGGIPITGVTLKLVHCMEYQIWCIRSETFYTTTNELGQYAFQVRPEFSLLETYQVNWNNDENNPARLKEWRSRLMTNNIITAEVHLDDFEMSDVKLLAPMNDILSNQPVEFQWSRRSASPGDSYSACIYWYRPSLIPLVQQCSELLGYVDSYTMTFLHYPDILYHAVIRAHTADGSIGYSFVQPVFMDIGQPCLLNSPLYFADVSGDGKVDALAANNDGLVVRRSAGTQLLPKETWANKPNYGTRGTYFGDVTGDGQVDMIAVNAWGVGVRRSDGAQFLPVETWDLNSDGKYVADVDGDGKTDLIQIDSSHVYVARSDGTQFLVAEPWTQLDTFRIQGNIATFFADATGDGKADEVLINDIGVTVRRSDGTQFLPEHAWTANPYYGSRGTYLADVTGDGKADAIVVNDSGVTVRRSDGTQFLPNETWTANPYYGSRGTYFADVTGDGKADVIVVNDNGVTVRRSDGTKFLPNETWTADPYYGAACLTNP